MNEQPPVTVDTPEWATPTPDQPPKPTNPAPAPAYKPDPAPPPDPVPPTAKGVTESDADFFRRLSTMIRSYDPQQTQAEELQKRRLLAALARVYVEWQSFLLAKNWPLDSTIALIDLTAVEKPLEDAQTLYARLLYYAEHQGMYAEDKHFLALQRFTEFLNPQQDYESTE